MVNIKDVARKAGVSISTVSRVINNSATVSERKQKAVRQAMTTLQYKTNLFAKALVCNKSNTIGLLVGELADPFFGLLMQGVEHIAKKHGKQLIVSAGHHDAEQEKQAILSLIDHRCDALVIHAKALSDQSLKTCLSEQPSGVVINHCIPDMPARCISIDNNKAACSAVQYLLKYGHTHIAYVERNDAIEDQASRKQGYTDALVQNNISYDPSLIVTDKPDEEGGFRAVETLLQQTDHFSAIFTYNDMMAAGCISALRHHGLRIPEDVSIIGFDDVLLARFLRPTLTTVHYPIKEMAIAAATQALKLSGENIDFTPICSHPTTLVERQTVLPIPAIKCQKTY
ncbi:HTH-type transcriptional regulator GalR [invertebrate metagenome]|uniref:HTH-type transcriptional regulator GalR n=1 Tax=invertebrate metagenome TaxID=1711999 RepID=A0A2H9TCC4_9ZZZZ